MLRTTRFTLQPLQEHQHEALYHIYLSNPHYLALTEQPDENGTYGKENILADFIHPEPEGREVWAICEGERMVGILDFLSSNPNDGCPWLGLLMFHGDVRNNGCGTEVVSAFCEYGREQGWTELRIGVIEENESALAFWKKQGFATYKEQRMTFGGVERTVVSMKRAI